MDVKFLADKAQIQFNTNMPLYIILVGVVVVTIGVLIFKKFDNHVKFVLPIMGGMAMVIGLIFWLSQQKLTLIIDKTAQSIQVQEKTSGEMLTSTLPFDNFRALIVQRAVSTSRNSSGTTSKSISFQIQLQRNDGAMVKLANYRKFKNAYEFVKELKKLVPYTTYIINTPIAEYQTYLEKFKQLEGVQVLDNYEPLLNLSFDNKQTPAKVQIPKNPAFATLTNSAGTTYRWSNRKNAAVLLLALVFVAGFFMLAQLIPHRGFKLGATIFIVIMGLIISYATINSFFGKSSLVLAQDQLTYRTELFGMKTHNQVWNYSDIAGMLTELSNDGDKTLNITSKSGQELVHRMAYQSPENLVGELMGLVMNYKSYFMTVDMSGLRLSERLYIETEISKKVAERRSK
ncbi:hypothetical protein BKI52_36710 [marine bacterium AO1-C]|nr:hypothetical protein BKI52_36710 [marine bacterium AO1-C]